MKTEGERVFLDDFAIVDDVLAPMSLFPCMTF